MSLFIRSFSAWHALGRRMASIAPCLMRPASSGSIKLGGKPHSLPVIEFNFLSDPRDEIRLRQGVQMAASLYADSRLLDVTDPPFVLRRAARLQNYNSLTWRNAFRSWTAAGLLAAIPPLGRAVLKRLAHMTPLSELLSDPDALREFIQQSTVGTGHVCGTCRMEAQRISALSPTSRGECLASGDCA